MGFSFDISIPMITVFFQGLLSFFSPCVLPLLPLYIGYLSGGTGKRDADGNMHYDRRKVLVHTFFFVLGVSFAFFLLGFGVSAIGRFFKGNQLLFARIGGILVILIGLYQLGIFGTSGFLAKEHRLPFHLDVLAMSPVTAFLLGFTFSFAWTPCVGPALASVLLLAASAASRGTGFLLIGVYTIGFVLPFLAVGLFTTTLLGFFRRHGRIVQYTVKAGAVLMIVVGILMFTGKMNSVTGYLSEISLPKTESQGAEPVGVAESDGQRENQGAEPAGAAAEGDGQRESQGAGQAGPEAENGSLRENQGETKSGQDQESVEAVEGSEAAVESSAAEPATAETTAEEPSDAEPDLLPAIDFTLTDQYGNTHTFSDYVGKTVFLNFWATWCPPCRNEMPDIQKLYEEYQEAGDDSVVILGIAAPGFGSEVSEEEIGEFLAENGYTYPVVMDTNGEIFMAYGVFSYPTTFMIDADGNVFGYVVGQISEDMMRSIIEQTVTGKRATAR